MEHLATQLRSQTSAPSDGSRTITLRDTQSRALDTDESSSLSRSGSVPGQSEGSDAGAVGTLRLRGVARRSTQRVAWGEDVVDNEGCGKKKSKICCIFRKERQFDESSSESSSSSGSDSDTGSCGDAHGHGHERHRHRRHGPNGKHKPEGESDSDSDRNAYERLPKSQRKGRAR